MNFILGILAGIVLTIVAIVVWFIVTAWQGKWNIY